jgi:hypothetical protein
MSGCLVIGAPRTRGVTFDGTNDYLTRAALSGIVNGDAGTFSVWMRADSDTDAFTIFAIASAGSIRMNVRRLSSGSGNAIFINLNRTTAPIPLAQLVSPTIAVTASDGWVHILASWDISASAFHLYIDDVADLSSNKDRDGDVTYDGGDVYIGETPVGATNILDGDLADLWFNTAYLDLSSSANRRKFISATGKPVHLGSTGERPTGASPILFLRGPAAGFHTNRGTGGDFSVTGALTDSATNPP